MPHAGLEESDEMLTTRSKLIPTLVLAAVVGFGVAFAGGAAIKKSNEPAAAAGSRPAPLLVAPGAAPKVAAPALGGAIPDLRSKPRKHKKPAPAKSGGQSTASQQPTTSAPQPAPAPSPAPAPKPSPPPSGSSGGSSGGSSSGSSGG